MNNANSQSKNTIDQYVAPFLTGLSLVVAAPTVERIRDDHYLVCPPTDESELFSNFTIPAYTAGEIIGAIAFPLLAIHGLDQMISADSPFFIEATMGTLFLTNVVSSLYEFFRER